ncbi:ABC transporter substrate-binding protein [Bradyrhizobium sp. LTSP857]|uniref:ABC transporter substrate-binding protein n=1 Tax=Bradyrhizobium sp. LTSP857 TaxID=1619231 RepID=UPI0005D1ECA3|nr:ABC transporter substrate-binding protein [Bradyrhizobium sp. LTSP857]KJC52201.1 hypothetical protein UP06_04005 [Bradyrhizobium sp. LTSP857]
MRRRALIFGGAATLGCFAAIWPAQARTQQQQTWRVGVLVPGFLTGPTGDLIEVFRQELHGLGYIEGKNLHIDRRAAEGNNERLPDLANELVALGPDVIVAVATPAIAAAQRATSSIAIVMTPAIDPIGSGFVKSFSHPGGNITGLANMYGDSITKIFDVLQSILPNAKKIAVLMSSNATHPGQVVISRDAAKVLDLSIVPIMAATPADLDRAFRDITNERCDAVFVLADSIRPSIVAFATAARIPDIYQISEFVEAGGLASYGPRLSAMWKRSAQYVVRIFKGVAPAELPVEQPTKFDLVINLKTAKSLGLALPATLLARADEVIE